MLVRVGPYVGEELKYTNLSRKLRYETIIETLGYSSSKREKIFGTINFPEEYKKKTSNGI